MAPGILSGLPFMNGTIPRVIVPDIHEIAHRLKDGPSEEAENAYRVLLERVSNTATTAFDRDSNLKIKCENDKANVVASVAPISRSVSGQAVGLSLMSSPVGSSCHQTKANASSGHIKSSNSWENNTSSIIQTGIESLKPNSPRALIANSLGVGNVVQRNVGLDAQEAGIVAHRMERNMQNDCKPKENAGRHVLPANVTAEIRPQTLCGGQHQSMHSNGVNVGAPFTLQQIDEKLEFANKNWLYFDPSALLQLQIECRNLLNHKKALEGKMIAGSQMSTGGTAAMFGNGTAVNGNTVIGQQSCYQYQNENIINASNRTWNDGNNGEANKPLNWNPVHNPNPGPWSSNAIEQTMHNSLDAQQPYRYSIEGVTNVGAFSCGNVIDDTFGNIHESKPWEPDPHFLRTAKGHCIDATNDGKWKRTDFPWSHQMVEQNRNKFGNSSFRYCQQQIINATLDCRDVFVLMPTGGGKSLCYQLPAVLTEGVTIVVSPLRSLIQDQVFHLHNLGIEAAALSGSTGEEPSNEWINVRDSALNGSLKVLFLTPEKLEASGFARNLLEDLHSRNRLTRVVIDEAHCVSQWGHGKLCERSLERKSFYICTNKHICYGFNVSKKFTFFSLRFWHCCRF